MSSDEKLGRKRIPIWGALIPAAIFLLNDFSNIFVKDYRLWLVIDYLVVKGVPLAILYWLVRKRSISWAELGMKGLPWIRFLFWSALMTLLGILLDQAGSRHLWKIFPSTRLGFMPAIEDPLLNQIDLTFGLGLVALVEELIFRSFFMAFLGERMRSRLLAAVISTALFGLVHWSLGLASIVQTALIGGVFMICFLRTGSILPTILAHFFVNYVAFTGMLLPFNPGVPHDAILAPAHTISGIVVEQGSVTIERWEGESEDWAWPIQSGDR